MAACNLAEENIVTVKQIYVEETKERTNTGDDTEKGASDFAGMPTKGKVLCIYAMKENLLQSPPGIYLFKPRGNTDKKTKLSKPSENLLLFKELSCGTYYFSFKHIFKVPTSIIGEINTLLLVFGLLR